MRGYKAFEKGLICKGKQYAENTVFEEEKAEICNSGMHFCKYPLDVFDYYPLIDNKGSISHACRGKIVGNIHDNPELIEEQDNESEEIKND